MDEKKSSLRYEVRIGDPFERYVDRVYPTFFLARERMRALELSAPEARVRIVVMGDEADIATLGRVLRVEGSIRVVRIGGAFYEVEFKGADDA
jgi:hypothetical protein